MASVNRCSCGKYAAKQNKKAPVFWPVDHKEELQEIGSTRNMTEMGELGKKSHKTPGFILKLCILGSDTLDMGNELLGRPSPKSQPGHGGAHRTDRQECTAKTLKTDLTLALHSPEDWPELYP